MHGGNSGSPCATTEPHADGDGKGRLDESQNTGVDPPLEYLAGGQLEVVPVARSDHGAHEPGPKGEILHEAGAAGHAGLQGPAQCEIHYRQRHHQDEHGGGDSGVRTGSEVSVHYDPMLAKLVVHAPDRAAACRRLAQALRDSVYLGIPTNVDFLRRVVEHPDFAAGELRTDFLDLRPELACGPEGDPPLEVFVAAGLAGVFGAEAAPGTARPGAIPGPWDTVGPLRLWGENS